MDNLLKKIGLELLLLILNCLGSAKMQRPLPFSSSLVQNLEPEPQLQTLKERSFDHFNLVGNLIWFHSMSVTGPLHVKRWEGAGSALCHTRLARARCGKGVSLAKASGRTFCSRCRDLLTRDTVRYFSSFIECE